MEYIFLLLFAALGILYFLGNKTVSNEVSIAKRPNEVWSVLINTDAYKEWNPVMELLTGEIKEGEKVSYLFSRDKENTFTIPTRVKKVIPGKLLNQSGGTPFIITFDHKYIIEANEEGSLLKIHENYKGVYVPFWNPKPVEKAYKKLSEAIKSKAESL